MPLDSLTRDATFAAPLASDALTITAIVATATPVMRRDGKGIFAEVLDPAGVDLTGLDLPLLDSHDRSTAKAVLGRATNFRREGDSIVADLTFSTAADVAPIAARVRDGSLTHFSVGYTVRQWAEMGGAGQRTKRAAAWTLNEVSLVSIPADPNARKRSMPKDLQPDDRAALIDRLRAAFNLPDDWATRAADVGEELTDDELRADAREAAQAQRAARKPAMIRTHGAADDPAQIITRQADAVAFRMAGGDLPAASREFVNMSLMDLARDSLTRAGVSCRGMSADEVLQRAAHTTSDFPLVVSNAANKVALDAYKAAETPLKALSRQRTLSDFKASNSIRMGGMGRLEPLTESGEFTATSRAERGESMQLATFGRRFDLSRPLMINDDLNLLGDTVAALGQAAAQTEADLMVDLITGNPNLSDNVAVFHASRDNLIAGAALDVAGIAAARQVMRSRTDLDGKTLISATPRFLLVGPALETEAEKVLAAIYAAQVADVNPFTGKLQLLVEPRLGESLDWFLFADPARLPCLAHAYLSGAQGVQIQRQEAWNTLGLSFRAFLDFGAAWQDWRGAQKMLG